MERDITKVVVSLILAWSALRRKYGILRSTIGLEYLRSDDVHEAAFNDEPFGTKSFRSGERTSDRFYTAISIAIAGTILSNFVFYEPASTVRRVRHTAI